MEGLFFIIGHENKIVKRSYSGVEVVQQVHICVSEISKEVGIELFDVTCRMFKVLDYTGKGIGCNTLVVVVLTILEILEGIYFKARRIPQKMSPAVYDFELRSVTIYDHKLHPPLVF